MESAVQTMSLFVKMPQKDSAQYLVAKLQKCLIPMCLQQFTRQIIIHQEVNFTLM